MISSRNLCKFIFQSLCLCVAFLAIIMPMHNLFFNKKNNQFYIGIDWMANVNRMKDSKAFGERLKDSLLRAGYELRPSVVEREFNQRYWGTPVTVQAVRKWLAGDVIPTQDKLQTLAEWLQIDPHWLRFGEERFGSIRAQEASWEVGMTQEDRDMISQFLALSLRERKVLRDFFKAYLLTIQ